MYYINQLIQKCFFMFSLNKVYGKLFLRFEEQLYQMFVLFKKILVIYLVDLFK